MKKFFVFIVLTAISFSISAQSWYKMEYKPNYQKNVISTEQIENGKLVVNSPASKSFVESFINEKIKNGWVVSFDMIFEEQSADGFIILTKKNQSIAMFNYQEKAWIISQHKTLASESAYLEIFYPGWFGKQQFTLEQIKQKLTASSAVPVYKETLQKFFN